MVPTTRLVGYAMNSRCSVVLPAMVTRMAHRAFSAGCALRVTRYANVGCGETMRFGVRVVSALYAGTGTGEGVLAERAIPAAA